MNFYINYFSLRRGVRRLIVSVSCQGLSVRIGLTTFTGEVDSSFCNQQGVFESVKKVGGLCYKTYPFLLINPYSLSTKLLQGAGAEWWKTQWKTSSSGACAARFLGVHLQAE